MFGCCLAVENIPVVTVLYISPSPKSASVPAGLYKPFPHNCLQLMVQAGAKGSTVRVVYSGFCMYALTVTVGEDSIGYSLYSVPILCFEACFSKTVQPSACRKCEVSDVHVGA